MSTISFGVDVVVMAAMAAESLVMLCATKFGPPADDGSIEESNGCSV